MTAFVLVHGAWHGSWAWEPVVPLLEQAGATVHAPELSADAELGLTDHVDEVIAVLDRSETAVVLVGHSYAGLVVRQAADRRPAKVARIVLIDGWAGPHGASLLTLAPDWFGEGIRAAAAGNGGELIPAPAPIAFGIDDPANAAWLESRLRPQPLRTFTDPTDLTGSVDRIPGTAIFCRPENFAFAPLARDLGYSTIPLDGPHDVMLTDPKAVSQLLLKGAEESALARARIEVGLRPAAVGEQRTDGAGAGAGVVHADRSQQGAACVDVGGAAAGAGVMGNPGRARGRAPSRASRA